MTDQIYCDKCYETFTKHTNLYRHKRNPPQYCYKRAELININLIDNHRKEILSQKDWMESTLNDQKESFNKQLIESNNKLQEQKEEYEQKIRELEEKHKLHVDNLIHAQPGVRNRTKVLQNIKAKNKVANFDKIISTTPIEIKTLRNSLKVGVDGDLLLFKKIFFENLPKETRCIRVRDFARDKYQIFDGSEWLTVSLNHIGEHFMNEIFIKYKPVIDEKHAKLDEVNQKYPRWKSHKKNMIEFDKVTDLYAEETEHYGKLATMNPGYLAQIKTGIRSMISANKSLVDNC